MSPAHAPAVVAVDAGSSRLRVSLVALDDGLVLQSGARPTPSAGGELDIGALWSDLIEIVAALDLRGARVMGIGVAAQLGMVIVDDSGRALRPAMLWDDVRAVAEAERLAHALRAEAPSTSGRRITAELPIAKLAWLAAHEPATIGRAARMLSLKDALVQRLTGRAVTDETHASYSGLFNVAARAWSPELAAAADVDGRLLPPALPGTAAVGPLAPEAARQLGLGERTPVAVGGPDGTLGVVGAGGVREGVTVDVAGTTDVLLHTTDRPVPDPAATAVLNAHVVPGLWTTGGPTGLTGGAIEWTAQLLGFATAKDAHEALGPVADALPGAGGLTFRTSLSGTRFPTWDTAQVGAIAGLRPEHGPAHLLRAAQEGAVFTVAEGLDAIRALGLGVEEVVVVGGAAARPAGLQLRSDAWNAPVVSLANAEATTIGAALLAGVAGGAFDDAEAGARALVRRSARHEPRPEPAVVLAGARARWRVAAPAPWRALRDAAPSS